MDTKREKISLVGISTFLSLVILIVLSFLMYKRQEEQAELVYSTLIQLQKESRAQSDIICNKVRDIDFAINDLDEKYEASIDIQLENLSELHRIILDKHHITDWIIRDSEKRINQAFLDFTQSENREIVVKGPENLENPDNDQVLERAFNEGIILYKQKKYALARDIFFDALSLYPHDKEIRFYYLTSLFYAEPENISNFTYLKDQLRLFTFDSLYSEKSLNVLASISLTENDMESAYNFYYRLYEDNETDLSYLRYRGMLAFQLGDYEDAEESFRSYLHSHSDDMEICYFYGLTLFNKGRFEDALNQFYLVQKSDISFGNLDDRITETKFKMENS